QEAANADRKAALADAHAHLGSVLQALGKTEEARREYDTALELRRQAAGTPLAAAPLPRQRAVAEAHERHGNLALEYGRPDDAAEQFRRARAILEPLMLGRVPDTPLRKSVEKVRLSLADAYLKGGKMKE